MDLFQFPLSDLKTGFMKAKTRKSVRRQITIFLDILACNYKEADPTQIHKIFSLQ